MQAHDDDWPPQRQGMSAETVNNLIYAVLGATAGVPVILVLPGFVEHVHRVLNYLGL